VCVYVRVRVHVQMSPELVRDVLCMPVLGDKGEMRAVVVAVNCQARGAGKAPWLCVCAWYWIRRVVQGDESDTSVVCASVCVHARYDRGGLQHGRRQEHGRSLQSGRRRSSATFT
jgi:hypothetical protein